MTSSRAGPTGTLRLTAWIFALGMAGQGVLGWLLAEDEFGSFAIAIGLGSLVYALRDGRVGNYLLERGRYASPNVPANAVWYSLGASVLAALGLAVLAPAGGWVFDNGAVRSVLLITAGAIPLGFFAPIATGLLQNHGRVRTAELFNIGATAIHYSLAALFAALDLGAASFVLPLLITNPLFSLAGWLAVRGLGVPFGRSSLRGIIRIGRRSRSVLLALAAVAVLRHGHLAALGVGASIEVVGFYYFGYQLAMGSAVWLTRPVRWVLVPTFASMHGDQWRRRRAALDSFLVGALLIGTVPLLLAALARPLEAVLWRGRWEEAVPVIQVFGLTAAFEVLVVVALMLYESSTPIRSRIEIVGGRGVGLVLLMALVGWLAPDGSPGVVASVAGAYLAISGAVIVIYVLEELRLQPGKVARAVATVYLITGSAAGLAVLADAVLVEAFSWLRLAAAASAFCGVVLIGSRMFFESKLRRIASVIERTTGNTLLQRTLRHARAADQGPVA